MNQIDLMIDYGLRFVGTPYIWGGSSKEEGFDCSGFVQEVLASAGWDPRGDQNAQGLYFLLSKTFSSEEHPIRGALLFFGISLNKISHIAIAINEEIMLEAGGGDSETKTKKDAIRDRAFVRLRPIKSRNNLVAILCPRS